MLQMQKLRRHSKNKPSSSTLTRTQTTLKAPRRNSKKWLTHTMCSAMQIRGVFMTNKVRRVLVSTNSVKVNSSSSNSKAVAFSFNKDLGEKTSKTFLVNSSGVVVLEDSTSVVAINRGSSSSNKNNNKR